MIVMEFMVARHMMRFGKHEHETRRQLGVFVKHTSSSPGRSITAAVVAACLLVAVGRNQSALASPASLDDNDANCDSLSEKCDALWQEQARNAKTAMFVSETYRSGMKTESKTEIESSEEKWEKWFDVREEMSSHNQNVEEAGSFLLTGWK